MKKVSSFFEFWPAPVFYTPVVFYWLWLSIRYRSLTLPTISNPSIYCGGVIFESKGDILRLLPPPVDKWVARWISFSPNQRNEVDYLLKKATLQLPLVGKPDIGQRGTGVQPLRTKDQLERYLKSLPPSGDFLLQELIDWEGEVGIFYVRLPDQQEGKITSITLKEFPTVIGNGKHTLKDLIEKDPRARKIKSVYFKRLQPELDTILPLGQKKRIVFSGNHCQGAIFKNGHDLITPQLTKVVDEISRAIPEFYFGRFDIRFKDVESLKQGKDFRIIEINGAMAEATHIWDAQTKLTEAYGSLFDQFRKLYKVSDQNRKRGHKPAGLLRLLKDVWRYRRLSQTYPPTH